MKFDALLWLLEAWEQAAPDPAVKTTLGAMVNARCVPTLAESLGTVYALPLRGGRKLRLHAQPARVAKEVAKPATSAVDA